jgi:exodeoxyribonuclease-5
MFEHEIDTAASRTGPPSGPDPGVGPDPAGLSPEQRDAAREIKSFLDSTRRVFSLQGLAGTGKSYLLASTARWLDPLVCAPEPDPLICAPTGRAASVLRERFGLKATTIHAAFYRLKTETRRAGDRRDLEFSPRRQAGSLAGRVLLIDESSMVTVELRDQLLATGVKIIAFGDPGQLPPVQGTPCFPQADFTLKQIHRQAAGSPIIRQAHSVRAGGNYQPDGDAFQVVKKGSHEMLREAGVVLCWTNEKRRRLNQLARRVLLPGEIPGRPSDDGSFDPRSEYPRAGERVVVLQNTPRLGLLNGDIEVLGRDLRPGDRSVWVFKVSESGSSAGEVEIPLHFFAGMPEVGGDFGGVQLDFGYVLTVHKAQGSEWPFVALIDEFPRHNPERARWIYTAITRASERVVVINPGR